MSTIKFADRTEYFNVEGTPVTISAGIDATPGMYCAAWDTTPPRHFDANSARDNGAPIKRDAFLALVAALPG